MQCAFGMAVHVQECMAVQPQGTVCPLGIEARPNQAHSWCQGCCMGPCVTRMCWSTGAHAHR